MIYHGIVQNTNTWTSWEQNMTFPKNYKILNLCLRKYILRSYQFVAEVAVNWLLKNSINSSVTFQDCLWLSLFLHLQFCCTYLLIGIAHCQQFHMYKMYVKSSTKNPPGPAFLLKFVPTIFYQIFIFHQMTALQKIWKMFFGSSKKLFSFWRYSNFCISVYPFFFSLSAIALEVVRR